MQLVLQLILFVLFVLTGCSKNPVSIKNFKNLQQEAKFADIPVPLNIKPLIYGISENSYAFQCSVELHEFLKFFIEEMEIFGWDKRNHISSFEELLVFEKPHKIAAVSIRHSGKNLNVFIFENRNREEEIL